MCCNSPLAQQGYWILNSRNLMWSLRLASAKLLMLKLSWPVLSTCGIVWILTKENCKANLLAVAVIAPTTRSVGPWCCWSSPMCSWCIKFKLAALLLQMYLWNCFRIDALVSCRFSFDLWTEYNKFGYMFSGISSATGIDTADVLQTLKSLDFVASPIIRLVFFLCELN